MQKQKLSANVTKSIVGKTAIATVIQMTWKKEKDFGSNDWITETTLDIIANWKRDQLL